MASTLPSHPPPPPNRSSHETSNQLPTMADILEASRAQGVHVRLRTLGPFFRVTARAPGGEELGRTEGVVRPWPGSLVLHLDSMRMRRSALLHCDRPLFGIGLFVGAAAVRHGRDMGCTRAELLAINDTPLYHSKLVRFYTRMGFSVVKEVDGSSIGDLAHMLVWGGRGTRMDADIEELLAKWSKRFRSQD